MSKARRLSAAPRKGPVPRRAGLVDFALMGLLSLVLVFGVVRPFVIEVFRIPSESMSPTLQAGDRVVVSKSSYRFGEPSRRDLAAFEKDGEVSIKRIVGLPGDSIEVRDGVLLVNDRPVREPYVDYRLTDASFFGPVTVPEDHVFVMGDNRSNSLDSRFFGPVPENDLLGQVSLSL